MGNCSARLERSAENAKRRRPHRKKTGGIRERKRGAPKKRRGPGKKSKNAKMAAVGLTEIRYVLTAGGIIALHVGVVAPGPTHPPAGGGQV